MAMFGIVHSWHRRPSFLRWIVLQDALYIRLFYNKLAASYS